MEPWDSAMPHASGEAAPEYGLTKREYFAAQIFGHLMSTTEGLTYCHPWTRNEGVNESVHAIRVRNMEIEHAARFARIAVLSADALIEALNKLP